MTKPRKPVAHRRTHDELLCELAEQRLALRKLSADFDEGHPWMAKLLSTVIYVLCHDGDGDTKSVLTQLGLKTGLQCLSTCPPLGMENYPLLLFMSASSTGSEFKARFRYADEMAEHFTLLPFNDWWSQSVFSYGGAALGRGDLIRAVRSQDGGGHFDATISKHEYQKLRTQHPGQVVGAPAPSLGAERLTVRAIAWELEYSLNAAFPQPQK